MSEADEYGPGGERESGPQGEDAIRDDQGSAAYPSAPKYAPGDSDKTFCQARYSTGEFVGFGCIERAKEERQGLGLCRVHAKVFDRWTKFGIDYVRSIVRLEWRRELA